MDQTGIVILEHLNLTAIENSKRGKVTRFITDEINFLDIFCVFEHNSPANFYITYASENPNFQNLLNLLKTENNVIEIPAENLANNQLFNPICTQIYQKKVLSHAKTQSLTDPSTLGTFYIHIFTL